MACSPMPGVCVGLPPHRPLLWGLGGLPRCCSGLLLSPRPPLLLLLSAMLAVRWPRWAVVTGRPILGRQRAVALGISSLLRWVCLLVASFPPPVLRHWLRLLLRGLFGVSCGGCPPPAAAGCLPLLPLRRA